MKMNHVMWVIDSAYSICQCFYGMVIDVIYYVLFATEENARHTNLWNMGINYILLVYILMESCSQSSTVISVIHWFTAPRGQRNSVERSFLSSYFLKSNGLLTLANTCPHINFAVDRATILFIPCNQLSVTGSSFSSGLVSATILRKTVDTLATSFYSPCS